MHVISWNLQARRRGWTGRIEDRVALIQELGQENEWDVLLLQEVPEGGAEELVNRLEVGADAVHHSWPQLSGGHKDAATATGAALIASDGWTVIEAAPLMEVPSPRRTMCGVLRHPAGHKVAVASAALPPAGHAQDEAPRSSDDWGAAKAVQAQLLADWVAKQANRGRSVIVGIDANGPRLDPPDWNAIDPWWDAELLLLGPDATVKDAYRRWLAERPEEQARIGRLRPHGPLACSHMRGGRTPSRYDHILVSDDVQVTSCSYVVGDAFAAGSDHALVQASLQVPGDG